MADRVLTKSRQRAVLALAAEQARLMAEAQECGAALDQLAADYAQHEGLEGKWAFVRAPDGEIAMRNVPEKAADEKEDAPSPTGTVAPTP